MTIDHNIKPSKLTTLFSFLLKKRTSLSIKHLFDRTRGDVSSLITTMFPLRKTSLPSPTMEDSFFPLSSASPVSLSYAIPSSSPENVDSGGGMETDLILAAELGQALLEKNEELAASLEQRERDLEVRIRQVLPSTSRERDAKPSKNYFCKPKRKTNLKIHVNFFSYTICYFFQNKEEDIHFMSNSSPGLFTSATC